MRPLASLAVVAALALPRSAAAQETTATTSIAQIMVIEPGSRNYRLFHGAVWLDYDKAQYNYRWGGLQCKGRELSDNAVQLLFATFRSEYSVTLEYVVSEFKNKQYRCITGFTIAKT